MLFIIEGITVLLLIVLLILDEHDFMRLVGKDKNVVTHDLESGFIPLYDTFWL